MPEFQGRINHHVQAGRRVLVSAHSQGSVIAFAALTSLGKQKLTSVALVTYGCPITTLYGALFPAYFGDTQIRGLRGKLLGGAEMGWWNFWRKTDPIGGPVFAATAAGDAQDVKVDDPATQPLSADIPSTPSELEDARPAWLEVAGHSHFFNEDKLRSCVRYMKKRLGNDLTPGVGNRAERTVTLDLTTEGQHPSAQVHRHPPG